MKKIRKSVVYALLVVTMVFMQMSTVLAELADSKTPLTVSDVGDENLYAVLAAVADPSGANKGILYKEDAENITSFTANWSSTYSSMSKIESFENLAKYCPNIEDIHDYGVISSSAWSSCVDEIAKLEKLKTIYIESYNLTSDDFKTLCGKTGAENLSTLHIQVRNSDWDLSDIDKFTGLTNLYVYVNSDASVKGEEALSKLENLEIANVNGYVNSTTKKLVDNLPASISSLTVADSYVNRYSTEAISLDFSRFENLTSLCCGYEFEEINRLISVELDKLPQALIKLELYNCDLGTEVLPSLSTKLSSIVIEYTELTDISAIEENTKISYANFANNNITQMPDLKNCTSLRTVSLAHNSIEEVADLSGISVDSINLSYNKLTKLPDLSEWCSSGNKSLYVSNNELTELPDMGSGSFSSLDISNNKITDISKLTGLSCLNTLNASYNQITSVPDLSNVADSLKNVYLQNNAITDISGVLGLKNCTNLCRLNLNYNEIKELPDLTEMTNLSGKNASNIASSFVSDDYYKFSLKGNKLTKEALEGKVPEDCINDIYWVYASTMRSTSNGTAYFENIDKTIVSKLLGNGSSASVYTTQKEFTLDKELLEYLKENSKTVYIYYIDENEETPEGLTVYGSSLGDITDGFAVNFNHVEYGEHDSEIDKAFASYGTTSFYCKVNDLSTGVDGIRYSAYADSYSNSDKYYNKYVYNEDGTFAYVSTQKGGSVGSSEGTYFYVDSENDKLIGIDLYTKLYGDSTYTTYNTYYKIVNDDVINGMVSSKFSNGLSLSTIAKNITLSEDTVAAVKSASKYLYINGYDTDEHKNVSQAGISPHSLNAGKLEFSLPDVTVSDRSESIEFIGATTTAYYTVSNVGEDAAGVSKYIYVASDYAQNIYTTYDSAYIPVSIKASSVSISSKDEGNTFFTVKSADDQLVKRVLNNGTYRNYYTSLDSGYIKKLVAYNIDRNKSININTIGDSVVLNADTVKLLKDNDKDAYFGFVSEDGAALGTASVSGSSLTGEDGITIEKPDVEITTSNKEISDLLPAGTAAIYVTNKSAFVDGVTYIYQNSDVLSSKFENTNYVRFHLADGALVYDGSGFKPMSSIRLLNGTCAFIKSADYDTPTDTPSTDNTSSVDTPTDTPSTDTPNTDTPIDTPSIDTPSADTPSTDTPSVSDTAKPTAEIGKNSVGKTISESNVVAASDVNEVLESKLTSSGLARVETYSNSPATLTSGIFSKMKESQKNITVGVTDENNRLQYSWSFDCDTLTNTNMDIDLSISFDTDRADAVKAITGRDDVVYLSFAHHGELPGPAKIKTYVGNQYKNGDVVYLYYFNEEKNRVETVGGKQGLVVNEGYVEYTITHCSLYFLSTETAEVLNAVDPDETVISPSSDADKADSSASTGDTSNAFVYAMETMAALLAIGAIVLVERKKAVK